MTALRFGTRPPPADRTLVVAIINHTGGAVPRTRPSPPVLLGDRPPMRDVLRWAGSGMPPSVS